MNTINTTKNLLLADQTEKKSKEVDYILRLPEDIIISILCNPILSYLDIENLSQVSSRFQQLSKNEQVWEIVCLRDLVQEEEISTKSNKQTWKRLYYLGTHSLGIIEVIGTKNNREFTIPKEYYIKYDPTIIAKIKQLKLSEEDYRILHLEEARLLMEDEDTTLLLKTMQTFATKKSSYGQIDHTIFRCIARHIVNNTEFEILNYTNILISFDPEYELLINGQSTKVTFTPHNCQLVVYITGDKLMIHNRDRGNNKKTNVCAFSTQNGFRLIKSLPRNGLKRLPRN